MSETTKPHQYYATASAESLLQELNTSHEGLSDLEAEKRLEQYGPNEPAKKKKRSLITHLFSKFLNPLVLILLVIAIFSFFFGEKISAGFVTLMILISVSLDFILEYRSSKAVEALHALVRTTATAYRGGQEKEVPVKDLVPGDIVILHAGDMVPADIRILSCKDLFTNQSSLTGESFPVEKNSLLEKPQTSSLTELTNMAFMGSSIESGTGLGLVVRTGLATHFGAISKSLTEASAPTSFDKGIRQFTLLMIRLIVVLVLFIFLALIFIKHGTFKEALLFSLAVAVGLTPEMLPMLVTINLSKGAIAMSRKKVIVKHLNSIQNFGAMDILCTDKTGTLTMDQIVLEKHCDVTGKEDDEVLKYAYINSAYQTGLLSILDKAILKHEKLMIDSFKKVDEIPFDFSRRVMSVVVSTDGKHLMVTKGAPEELFKRCSLYELNGKIQKINQKVLATVKKEYDQLSGEGFRVLAIAYKEITDKKPTYTKEDESDLILKGYAAFLDPPKPQAKETLLALQKLGIQVKVLTGDNEIITQKICHDAGLDITGISTGTEIESLTDEELSDLVEKTSIFARLTPAQKERIIRALQKNKHTIGFLGDGINDAPSLKTSDVGISVNNAVDIAKESADLILLEKSLMVLREGVEEGRKVFGNIIKYVKMGASSNFGNMFSMTGATLFLPFLPMLPIQILLNNFLYDLSNIALPTDQVDPEYLTKPRPWNIDFIKKFIFFIGPLSSIYDFMTYGVMLFVFHAAPDLFHTGWFLESLCTQTLIIYVIRTNKIPFIQSRPSKTLLFGTLLVLAFAFALPWTPLAQFFGFVQLPGLYFVILAFMLITYMTLVQVVKSWMVKKYGYQ